MGTESFSGLMQPQRGADHPPPATVVLRKDGSCTAGYPFNSWFLGVLKPYIHDTILIELK